MKLDRALFALAAIALVGSLIVRAPITVGAIGFVLATINLFWGEWREAQRRIDRALASILDEDDDPTIEVDR